MLFLTLFMTSVQLLLTANARCCPALCDCTLKDAVRCSSPAITNITSLGLPTDVTYIEISGTSIARLDDNSFCKMHVVLRLLLWSNQISTIAPGAFNSLVELKTIMLTRNKLFSLPAGLFDQLVQLQQLFLDQNSLTHLEPNLFNRLINLQDLFLNKNKLTMLPGSLFQNLAKLKVLNLSRNQLASLPLNIFHMLKCLEKLSLYDNELASIEAELFRNLENLVELSCFDNRIEIIAPGAFNSLHKLEILKFSKNNLQLLPSGLFLHLPNLTSLTLYENPLKELPGVLFGVMERLTELWIYKTELYTLPDFVFSNLTNLELLVLTKNPQLGHLPRNAFSGLRELVELALHTNNLTILDADVFQDLQNLKVISLYSNDMRDLPVNLLRPLGNLQKIYLNDTKLENLPGDFFSSLPKLQEVVFQGNPWHCNCEIKDFKGWLQTHMNIVRNPTSLTCALPLPLQNVPLLSTDQFLCQFSKSSNVLGPTGSSTSLGTTLDHPTPQPEWLARGTSNDVQNPELTTAPTLIFEKTIVVRVNLCRKHTEANSASPSSTTSSYSNRATSESTSNIEFHQTAPSDQILHDKTKTTGGVFTTLNTSPPTYGHSTIMQNPWSFFHFKTPYSKIFFYLHLLSLFGQTVTIIIAVCVLYKIRRLLTFHSFALPVVLVKISVTVNEETLSMHSRPFLPYLFTKQH